MPNIHRMFLLFQFVPWTHYSAEKMCIRDSAHTTLSASGLDVGLPAGQMGNSEVGHTNIGGGRVVFQVMFS